MQSSSRNGAAVIWLAIHSTEGIMRATDLRDWTSWPGSSHASSDETGVLFDGAEGGFVDYSRAAWTMRAANPIADQIEQCAWARWTRNEWLARPLLLDATARWLAKRSAARGIPLVRLSAAEIRAHKAGVLGHGDYSAATGDGDHSDPGLGYPWDVVLAKATAYRDGTTIPQEDEDMNADQVKLLQATKNAVDALLGVAERPIEVERRLTVKIDALTELVSQLATRQGTPIDMDAVEAVVQRGVQEAISSIDTTVTVKPA